MTDDDLRKACESIAYCYGDPSKSIELAIQIESFARQVWNEAIDDLKKRIIAQGFEEVAIELCAQASEFNKPTGG